MTFHALFHNTRQANLKELFQQFLTFLLGYKMNAIRYRTSLIVLDLGQQEIADYRDQKELSLVYY